MTNEKELTAALLATPEGRIFCGLLLETSGCMRPVMRETDRWTAYAEGMRAVGLAVFELLWEHDETLPLQCMNEYGQWLKDNEKTKEETD